MTNVSMIENAPITDQIITLRCVYKITEVRIYPVKDKNTGRLLGNVKPVDANGDIILSLEERASGQYFAKATDSVLLKDGYTLNLADPYDKATWEWLKHSKKIAMSLEDAAKTPSAEFYVFMPEVEAAKSVSVSKSKAKAFQFVVESSTERNYQVCRLLGHRMDGLPYTQVEEFLFSLCETNPKKIIETFTDSKMKTRLFLMDALDKNVIVFINNIFMYKTQPLGTDEDYVISWLQDPANITLVTMIKDELYPQYMAKETNIEKETKKK